MQRSLVAPRLVSVRNWFIFLTEAVEVHTAVATLSCVPPQVVDDDEDYNDGGSSKGGGEVKRRVEFWVAEMKDGGCNGKAFLLLSVI